MNAIARVAVIGAAAGAAAVVGFGYWFSEFALNRNADSLSFAMRTERDVEDADAVRLAAVANQNRERMHAEADAWLDTMGPQPHSIVSADGLTLYGETLEHEETTHRWAVLLHGFTGSCRQMGIYAHLLYPAGYNVLWVDLRASGKSGGTYSSMGAKESGDLIRWLEWLERYDSEGEAVVLGVSLGASTALEALGNEMPPIVKCVVSDCAFSSLRGEYADKIHKAYPKVSAERVLDVADLVVRARFGFSLSDVDACRALSHNTLPVLYIHGDADDFNPYWMHFELIGADGCPDKAFMNVHGARHAMSVYMEPEAYRRTVLAFCDRFIQAPAAGRE